jgi:hypothetical protein
MRNPPDPKIVQQCLELVAVGCSAYETAHTLGVTEPTVRRWVKRYGPVASKPEPEAAHLTPFSKRAIPAHMMAPELPPHKPVDPSDTLGLMRQLVSEQHERIRADQAAGLRGAPVSSAMSTLEKLTTSLRRLEAAELTKGDAISVSAADFATACADLDAKARAYAERGGVLRCADCNRALSIQWGLGPAVPDAADEGLPHH